MELAALRSQMGHANNPQNGFQTSQHEENEGTSDETRLLEDSEDSETSANLFISNPAANGTVTVDLSVEGEGERKEEDAEEKEEEEEEEEKEEDLSTSEGTVHLKSGHVAKTLSTIKHLLSDLKLFMW